MATFYIHWPFCLSKCSYCSFYSEPIVVEGCSTEKRIDYAYWLKRYQETIELFVKYSVNQKITSIYFGGGTPSLLPVSFVSEVIKSIKTNFDVLSGAEITIEANPRTIDIEKAGALKEAGINRISIGVQSIYDRWLMVLGRISHGAHDGISCVNQMSKVFDNVSIDMIYNRPGQGITEWALELKEVMDLFCGQIKHISCYELIVEENTPLYTKIKTGELPQPVKSSDSAFLDTTRDILAKNGFEMYEVSNFAKGEEFYGQHNLSYWRYEDFFGVGPGAHSRVSVNGQKIAITQLKGFEMSYETLSEKDVLKEKLIMGLRAKCGIAIADLKGVPNLDKKMLKLSKSSYIIYNCGRVVVTYEGLKRANLVVEYIFDGC